MDLIPNSVCSLCDENTSVLSKKSVQPFIKTVGKVFFNSQNDGFIQFQNELVVQSMCSLCVHKISTCTRFKNKYEESNKQNGLKKTRSCFVCEKKGLDLIRTFDDPNDIIAKFTLFTNYSSTNISYEDCEMCLDCLFYISTWCEIHNNLIKKLSIDGEALKSFQRTKHSSNLKKGKENVTPPHNNIQVSNKKLSTINAEKNSRPAPKSKKGLFKGSKKKKILLNKLPRDLSKLLNKKFKNIKCLQDGALNELNWPESVVSDIKMFKEIPYVLISKTDIEKNLDSHPKRSSRLNKPNAIINITDSEDEPVKKPTRVSFQLPPKESSSEQLELTCNICDQTFLTTCNYKSHCLWHEKPQFCQIDLIRSELPIYVKASDFNVNNKSSDEAENVIDISHIIAKYIDNYESQSISDKSEEKPDASSCEGNVSKPVETDLLDKVLEPENSERRLDFSDNGNSDKLINEIDDEAATVHENTNVCCETEKQVAFNADSIQHDTELEDPEPTEENTPDVPIISSTENVDDDSNCEGEIEHVLAKLHDEVTNNDTEGSINKEDKLQEGGTSDYKDVTSDDNDDGNTSPRNHKRNSSPLSLESSDDENTPKIKKVRFAIDYSYTKRCEAPTENETKENGSKEVEDVSEN